MNRKHGLCNQCNSIRLHGAGELEKRQQAAANKLRSGTKKRVNGKSGKQKEEDKLLVAVYAEMDRVREFECSGCGTTKHLSRSHLIPRSRRKDLVTELSNLTWHCLVRNDQTTGCHQRWESHLERLTLNDYQQNMAFIKRVDPEYFFLIKAKERQGDVGI